MLFYLASLLSFVNFACGQYKPVRLYDDKAMGGEMLVCDHYGLGCNLTSFEQLTLDGWDNKVSSVCMEGLWFLYEDEFFNLESDEASMLWAFGKQNFCLNLDPVMDNKISSLKYEVAIYVPVWLAAYDRPGFTGSYCLDDSFTVTCPLSSLVVGGGMSLTLWDTADQSGRCECVVASKEEGVPGMYPDTSRFAVFNDPKETPVVSVTSGCNCSITTLPINYDDNSLHYGYYTMKP